MIDDALGDTRAVVVSGARQVGKSTLVNHVVRGRSNVLQRNLDRPSDLAAARSDPESFVRHDGLLVIDEVQRATDLLLPIKARVDEVSRPGQFLLTGSARLLGMRGVPDALVGRSETIELWPFSQGEIEGVEETFLDRAFGTEASQVPELGMDRPEYLARALRGGYPEAIARTDGRRAKFFASYVNDLIDRDIVQVSDIQRRPELHRVLRLLAGRIATPLKVESVASELGLPKSTVDRYISLLEEVFLIKRIPAWSRSSTSRAVQMRKLMFVDTGLAAHLSGRTLAGLGRDSALAGAVIENFVLGELARQLGWSETFASLHHYRTRDGEEVDAIVEAPDGRIVAVEVKASTSVGASDFRHLKHLAARVPEYFHHGYVLYTGSRVLQFGERMTAAPIASLWS
jgi:uncharacterized protein